MLKIETSNGASLLKQIKEGISNGSVQTWSFDKNGDFTHTPTQWRFKGFFRPRVTVNGLEFGLVPAVGGKITREVYAVYHGRFAEMLLAHFDSMFGSTSSTALATTADIIAA
jgi:hypothetical protein